MDAVFFLAPDAWTCHNSPQWNFLDEAATNKFKPDPGWMDVERPNWVLWTQGLESPVDNGDGTRDECGVPGIP